VRYAQVITKTSSRNRPGNGLVVVLPGQSRPARLPVRGDPPRGCHHGV